MSERAPAGELPPDAAADRDFAWRRGGRSGGWPGWRFWVAAGTAAALAGLVVWLAAWLRPPPATVFVLVEADYATNLAVPLNPYAPAARRGLAAQAQADAAAETRPHVAAFHSFASDQKEALLAELKEGDAHETRVVFVSLHGIAEDGKAYLLAGDAGTGSRTTGRTPLTDVLAALGQSRAGNKLLVLDATGLTAATGLGVFRNNFADVLNGLDAEIRAVPNLVVLSASGPAERSWPAPEYGRTAFAHFVTEGLAGAADADGNRRVTARELFEYAANQTRAYAERHYAARQTPVLLPAGDGLRRATAMHLVHARATYRPPEPCTFARPQFKDISEEWKRFHELADNTPPPQAYAPETWMEYGATLRRAEQLNMVGLTRGAGMLTDRLGKLRTAIEQRREIYITLASYTSCSAIAISRPVHDAADRVDQAIRLVQDRNPARPVDAALFAELVRARLLGTGAAGPILTTPQARQDWVRLVRIAILKRADDDVRAATGSLTAALRPAVEYARILNEQGGQTVQPLELNLLGVLARDLAPGSGPEWRERVALALELRRKAEEAAVVVRVGGHSYSELVNPWVAEHITRGDHFRRRFEDRLFGEPGADTQGAIADHDSSRAAYETALADAETVRRAIEEYHHSAADLHGYARWAALIPPPDTRRPGGAMPSILAKVEHFSTAVAALAVALRTPDPAGPHRPIKELDTLRGAVAAHREELEAEYSRAVATATELPSPVFWTTAESVLVNAPVPRNKELRDKQRAARVGLLTAWVDRVWDMRRDNPTTAGGPDPATAQRHARAASAVLQLAVAGYGTTPPDELTSLLTTLCDPQAGPDAGPRFGQVWDELPKQIVEWCRSGFTAGAETEEDDTQRTARFATASALSRALDGTTNGRLFYHERESHRYVTVRPADADRRWLIRRLLDRQAERTIADHWFDDALNPRPYFRLAATVFLDEQLPLSPDLRATERHSARGHRLLRFLDQRDELDVRFATTAPVVGTAEDPVSVRPLILYRPPDPPDPNWEPTRNPGNLAYWLEVPADPASDGGPVVSRRHLGAIPPPPTTDPPPLVPVTLQTSAVGPSVISSQVILRARFRGRILERSHDLALSPIPDVVIDEIPPPPGRVAVRGAPDVRAQFGDSPGAVAVVLDCSGSMGTRPGENRNKYDVAVDALLEVLGRLPDGTGLSIWVFGADVPGERLTTPEDTVRRIRPLTPLNKQGHLAAIEASLRPLRPMYESPITFAALRAREELAAGPAGFTSLILLTDGLDNRWEKDTRNNPTGRPVAEALRAAFDRSNVRLDVIAFSVPKEEADGVQAQFRVAEQLAPPGRFINVAEVAKLVVPLREAVLANRQIGYLLRSASDPAIEYRLTAGGPGGDGWSPPLLSGAYQLWVGTPPLRMPDLTVHRGDSLITRLVPENSHLRLVREIVTDREYGNYPPGLRKARTNDWQVAVAENRVEAGTLRLVPLLERISSPTLLEVVRPARVWFEVSGASASPPGRLPAVRWKPDFTYPAPAWQIEAPGWLTPNAIAPPRPRLRVWWDSGAGVPSVTATTTVPAGEVTITGTEVRPDALGGSLLSVSITCPPGRAFWVNPKAPGWVVVSHRFYRSVGRVVATFRADRSVSGPAPREFELVSVEQFKVVAARAGNTLELPALDEPAIQLPAVPRKTAGARE